METAVVVAVLAAIASMIGSLLSWLAQRDVRKLTTAQEAQLAQLRADLTSTEARLRNDLARDLAVHESALRVRAEIRLRLFERSAESTEEAIRVLGEVVDAFMKPLAENESLDRGFRPLVALNRVGLFLPVELDEGFQDARSAMSKAFDLWSEASESETQATNATASAGDLAIKAHIRFQKLARDWKRSAWQSQSEETPK